MSSPAPGRDDARRSAARPCAMGSFGIDEPVQVDDRQSRCNTFIGTAEPESEETGVTGKISTQTNRTLSVPVHCKSANAGTLQAMQRHAAEQLNGEQCRRCKSQPPQSVVATPCGVVCGWTPLPRFSERYQQGQAEERSIPHMFCPRLDWTRLPTTWDKSYASA